MTTKRIVVLAAAVLTGIGIGAAGVIGIGWWASGPSKKAAEL